MDVATFTAVVDQAKLAPSAHNTQPARWALRNDGAIAIWADLGRRLPVGDPTDRDLMVSCGAAVEATVLALAQHGFGAQVQRFSGPDQGSLRPVATVTSGGRADSDDVALAAHIGGRLTHRLGFRKSGMVVIDGLAGGPVTLVKDPADIGWLSEQIDVASVQIMQDAQFRAELLMWMRLSQRDAGYHRDGLNRDALALDRLTAFATRPVLGTRVYKWLSALGLGPALSGEASKSRTSTAILLFHWPKSGDIVDAGRMFYRTWLQAAALGLAGWPAAALADEPQTTAAIARRFDLPSDHLLFNALRVGMPNAKTPTNTRLPTSELIVSV